MRNEALALFAVKLCERMYGKPYRWGGDDPMAGFDCSGAMVEILKSCGILDHHADLTADGLWNRYPRTTTPTFGTLVLFGTGRATHVGMVDRVIGDSVIFFEFGGGGSKTLTTQDAISQNAFGRYRVVNGPGMRTDLLGYCDPFEVG